MKPKRLISKLNFLKFTHIPLIVYGVVGLSMILLWILHRYIGDFAFDLLAEFIGVAFTVFIIDTLLVRSKTRRWKIVQDNMDYLIARNVNRLRDGMATRFFGFVPEIDPKLDAFQNEDEIREQRTGLLSQLATLSDENFSQKITPHELFNKDAYDYLNEKADDIWQIVNMKYSEYLEPELVSLLIDLHTNLKDLCGHIRQHKKSERYTESTGHYRETGTRGASATLRRIVEITNELKNLGYSRPAEPGFGGLV